MAMHVQNASTLHAVSRHLRDMPHGRASRSAANAAAASLPGPWDALLGACCTGNAGMDDTRECSTPWPCAAWPLDHPLFASWRICAFAWGLGVVRLAARCVCARVRARSAHVMRATQSSTSPKSHRNLQANETLGHTVIYREHTRTGSIVRPIFHASGQHPACIHTPYVLHA